MAISINYSDGHIAIHDGPSSSPYRWFRAENDPVVVVAPADESDESDESDATLTITYPGIETVLNGTMAECMAAAEAMLAWRRACASTGVVPFVYPAE